MNKMKIVYYSHTSRNDEVVTSKAPQIDGDWLVFMDGVGHLALQVRVQDVERIESAS